MGQFWDNTGRTRFASEPGVQLVYAGAVQRIDTSSPILGPLFGPPDSAIAVTTAIAISAQTFDGATRTVSVLSPGEVPNTMLPTGTATLTIFGELEWHQRSVFTGAVQLQFADHERHGLAAEGRDHRCQRSDQSAIFFCVTASATLTMPPNANSCAPVDVTPGTIIDFLAGAVTDVEFHGFEEYGGSPLPPALSTSFGAGNVVLICALDGVNCSLDGEP